MNDKTILPDHKKKFGIRFESIAGLGADTAAQILAKTAVLHLGLNSVQFSSYGHKKKGAAMRSFIRFSEKNIRSTAPIESPDVIVVFHSALLKNPATLAGMKADGILIYNGSDKLPANLSHLPSTTKLIQIDAQRIALKEKTSLDAVLLGTITAALPFLDFSTLQSIAPNKNAFQRGAQEFEILSNIGKGKGNLPISKPKPTFGYETAPIGGTFPCTGNTIENDLSTIRIQWLPILNIEKCVHCGICEMVCPDFCFVWAHGKNNQIYLQGIDYQYCKACLRCVESCSTGALRRKSEEPGMADKLGMRRLK